MPPEATPPATETPATAPAAAEASPEPTTDAIEAWAAADTTDSTEVPAGDTPADADKTPPATPAPATDPPAPAPVEADSGKAVATAATRERKALEREKAAKAVLDKAAEYDDVMSDASKLLAAANKRGVSTKALLDAVIAAGADKPTPTAEQELKAEVVAIKDELAQARQRNAQIEYQRVAGEIKTTLKTEPKRFGLLDAFGAHQRVLDGIARYYKVNGEDPDPKDIAEHVVNQLRKEHPAEVVAHWEKFYNPPADPAPAATPDPQRPPQPVTLGKTLTNAASGAPPPRPGEEDPFPLDTDERLAAITKAGW